MAADQARQPVPVAAPPAGARSFTPLARSFGGGAPVVSMGKVPTESSYTKAQVNAAFATIINAAMGCSDQCGAFAAMHLTLIEKAMTAGMWETDAGK